jgi:hypothetical protein
LNNDSVDPLVGGTRRVKWEEINQLFLRYPNIVLWINGHTHYNYIRPHPAKKSISKGYWEVNTASHIDYPQQSRVFEIDSDKKYLSIYTTLIDHDSKARSKECSCYTNSDMASISRELAVNNIFVNPLDRLGQLNDRNTQLLIENPLKWKIN